MISLLDVRDLSVVLRTGSAPIAAVEHVNLTVAAGATLGLVGESGCGKSLTCLAMMGLLPPQARTTGSVCLDGIDLAALPERQLERVRGRDIAMVFQDAQAALNPVRTIGAQIAEVLVRHRGLTRSAARAEALRLLDRVRIPGAGRRLRDHPHQLSGGMCQRAMIAMAIAGGPRVLIADEPTTALDVTVQAQVLALLKELQRDLGMALVLVTHDLGLVAQMADHVAVMYAGRVVERAAVVDLFRQPLHPYSVALLGTLPGRAGGRRLASIPGSIPSLDSRPAGCAFQPRCIHADEGCSAARPVLTDGPDGRAAACRKIAMAA